MYDRRLDAIVATAELGSFTKAAARLHVSTTALAKQVSSFEGEHGITVFSRTRQGARLTPTGEVIVAEARSMIRQSAEALARARARAGESGGVVRLGVSVLSPGRKVLDLWPAVHDVDPTLKLELTPIGSVFDERQDVVGSLGREVDLVLTGWSRARWEGRCQALPMGALPLGVDVPARSPLASWPALRLSDLAGTRVFALRHGTEAMDGLVAELRGAGAHVEEVADYTLGLFNECAGSGGALVTSGAWSGLHPMLTTVPLAEERLSPCALLYPLDPSPAVKRFVAALARVMGAEGQDTPTASAST